MYTYDLVMFDMDGTLVDSAAAHQDMFDDFFGKHYPEYVEMNLMQKGRGETVLNIFKALGMTPEEKEVAFDKLDHYYLHEADKYIEKLVFIDGAKDVIELLKKNDIHVGMVSNSMHDLVVRIMQANNMEDVFDAVLGAHRDEKDKVARFDTILEQTNVRPDRALYVGDAELDVDVSRKSGIDCCILYTPIAWATSAAAIIDDKDPDYVIKDIQRIANIAL